MPNDASNTAFQSVIAPFMDQFVTANVQSAHLRYTHVLNRSPTGSVAPSTSSRAFHSKSRLVFPAGSLPQSVEISRFPNPHNFLTRGEILVYMVYLDNSIQRRANGSFRRIRLPRPNSQINRRPKPISKYAALAHL